MTRIAHRCRGPLLILAVLFATTSPCWATDLSGHWEGSWHSAGSGHSGPLSADFCRLSNGNYQVTFRGRFWKIMPFRYRVVLCAYEDDQGQVHLSGTQSLGRLSGTYHYRATASDCSFRADFWSCRERGVFCLTRRTRCGSE